MTISYSQNIDDCLASEIGDGGLESRDFQKYQEAASKTAKKVCDAYWAGNLPFLAVPHRTDDLSRMRDVADRYARAYLDIVILGTGASSLGGRTLCSLQQTTAGPRLHFMDNVDPSTFASLINTLDWNSTGIVAISKSGSTAETLAQLGVLVDALRTNGAGDRLSECLVIVTEPTANPLASVAERVGCVVLDHDTDIGGRYSALSITGLLPAFMAGLDVEAIRAGAAAVLDDFVENHDTAAPTIGAAVSVGLNRMRGVSASVFMPYCDRLNSLALWYRQLWAESLGKKGEGTLPVQATGATDQHSQLQLYLDGPADKMFTLLLMDTAGKGPSIPDDFAGVEGLSYLKGRTIGDLLSAEGRATLETLANNGRPTRLIEIAEVNEISVGALMMHFMLETVIAAGMLGVDPYDQPAVEEGKALTREFLRGGRGQ